MQRGPVVLIAVLATLLLLALGLYYWNPQNSVDTAPSLDTAEADAIAFVQSNCEQIGGDAATVQSCKDNAARLVAEDFAGARECEKSANKDNPECQPGFNVATP